MKFLAKYSSYSDIFSIDLAIKLPKNIDMNKYAIKLVDWKQSSYELIYILGLVELKILKTYIKTYWKTEFICPSKSFTGTLNLFDKSPDNIQSLPVDRLLQFI